MAIRPQSFISRYPGMSRELINEVFVSSKLFLPNDIQSDQVDINTADARKYRALWDTGATCSLITQKIIDELNLKPTGIAKVSSATHVDQDTEVYMVSIFLPNQVCVPNVRVTKGKIRGPDMLIGMDIINYGDFAVTHNAGKTSFSFRIPSLEEIDFTQQQTASAKSSKVSRNAPCPCGSGKKYKKCCGRPT